MERKKMAFAGSWYPLTASECEASIQGFLSNGQVSPDQEFIGGIVPHAGWYYSGSIACRVIANLKTKQKVDTILLFGAHMHSQSRPFILGAGSIETPFGDIETDSELVDNICNNVDIARLSPAQFPDDNTLELQFPFIKHFFPDAKIVVCGVPPTDFASVVGAAVVVESKKLSRSVKIVGSTDMTHYGPNFEFTVAGSGRKAVDWVTDKNDRDGIKAMLGMNELKVIATGLDNKNMCCPGAAAAAIAACKENGAVKAVELDYATSFSKSASDSFVGYAGILYS
jgi:AmmeMemoRadiSam system protein B